MGHPDNYIPADPMQTPPHIVPEWYFLPFYAILRSIPDKLGGVLAMGGSLIVLFFIPFLNTSEIRSTDFRPIFKFFFLGFSCCFSSIRLDWPKTCYRYIYSCWSICYLFLFLFLYFFNTNYWIC